MWDFPKYGCPGKQGSSYFYFYNTGLQNQRYVQVKHVFGSFFIFDSLFFIFTYIAGNLMLNSKS